MELTADQQQYQLQKQMTITSAVSILGIIAGIIYASNTGKSKLGWAIVGMIAPSIIVGIILNITDYGNPTK